MFIQTMPGGRIAKKRPSFLEFYFEEGISYIKKNSILLEEEKGKHKYFYLPEKLEFKTDRFECFKEFDKPISVSLLVERDGMDEVLARFLFNQVCVVETPSFSLHSGLRFRFEVNRIATGPFHLFMMGHEFDFDV